VENKAPSFESLKDSECFWVQVTPYIAGMNETLDGKSEDEIISTFLYYEADVTEIEDEHAFPFKELRVNIAEKKSEEIMAFSGKYPVGFIRFFEGSASVTLMCRTELVSRMVSTLSMVKSGEIEFFLTFPKLSTELPSVYPILNYQYRVRSRASTSNA